MTRWMHMAVATAGVCAALASAPAAALTSQLTLQWTGVDLIDLDPDDGVSPSITFTTAVKFLPLSTASNMAYSYTPDGQFEQGARNGSAMDGDMYFPFGPDRQDSAVTLYNLSTSSQGELTGTSGFSLSVQGSGLGYEAPSLDMGHPWAYGAADYRSSIVGLLGFQLSANTLASFTLSGQGSVTGGTAQASALNAVFAQVYTYGTDSASVQIDGRGSFTRTLNIGNLTNQVAVGNLTFSAETTGYFSGAAPVPEPQGWALLLAGAAVVSGWRRRVFTSPA